MRRFKHWAYLNETGMEFFGDVFPDKTVPVVSMIPTFGPFPTSSSCPQKYYKVIWEELTPDQQKGVLEILSKKFGARMDQVRDDIARKGLPLREILTNGSGTDGLALFM